MSAPHTPDPGYAGRGPMFWLPPHGFGNGISAQAWAEIADLTAEELPEALLALTEADIAAYTAAVRGRPGYYRLWVDSLRYLHAEDVLMDVLRS
ncbi:MULTISPECIES: hypothetical protein [Amycolatopsis]|uniref:Uncharacterized protein n=1 Tax=Amycolatopsis echigonensis TaxID=2576905 RepID=A0A2N3WLD9_9PSEU|nr:MULTISPECIES: hypothetical protein [Amycolatopsis]MBB2500814.1 hypothetical protein [Amycolatopsis echigonensis]MCG3751229.1 hypothetical protein [Amycolatopsis sp. Poz14]PKV94693.1 hypothetical protein ATK30_5574 [Amycolatopsis niigatensis]